MSELQQATQDARPSGPSIRQLVLGAPTGKPTTPGGGDPFLAPFFETAIEHVWGGVWNRPGLDLKCERCRRADAMREQTYWRIE
jgi:hypothetical protein